MDSIERRALDHLSPGFCVLAGAGISYPAPARLPTAWSMMRWITEALPIPRAHKATLQASFSPDWDQGLGYFDFLRFEQVFEALQRSVDENLLLAREMLPDTQPNRYHYQLAELIRRGHKVMTTNFDCLIEKAALELGFSPSTLAREEDYELYLKNPDQYVDPLFKLHGSLDLDGSSLSFGDSLSATLQAVVSDRLSAASKWDVVQTILGTSDLLVIAYSGSDDFDIMPLLKSTPRGRRILWVQHSQDQPSRFRLLSDEGLGDLPIENKLRWYFETPWGGVSSVLEQKGVSVSDVAVALASTQEVLDRSVPFEMPLRAEEGPAKNGPIEGRIESYAREILGRETAETFLFAGLLFASIGLFEEALSYLFQALAAGPELVRSKGRIHAAIAKIWLERDRQGPARRHMREAICLVHQEPLGTVDFQDLCEFSFHLGSPAPQELEAALHKMPARQKRILGRRLEVTRAKASIRSGRRFEEAFAILERHLGEPWSRELEEWADSTFLFLEHWRWLSGWDSFEEGEWDPQMNSVCGTFELLQCRKKWADSALFLAESYLARHPDWARDQVAIARTVYQKIGNEQGLSRCEELLRHIDPGGGPQAIPVPRARGPL